MVITQQPPVSYDLNQLTCDYLGAREHEFDAEKYQKLLKKISESLEAKSEKEETFLYKAAIKERLDNNTSVLLYVKLFLELHDGFETINALHPALAKLIKGIDASLTKDDRKELEDQGCYLFKNCRVVNVDYLRSLIFPKKIETEQLEATKLSQLIVHFYAEDDDDSVGSDKNVILHIIPVNEPVGAAQNQKTSNLSKSIKPYQIKDCINKHLWLGLEKIYIVSNWKNVYDYKIDTEKFMVGYGIGKRRLQEIFMVFFLEINLFVSYPSIAEVSNYKELDDIELWTPKPDTLYLVEKKWSDKPGWSDFVETHPFFYWYNYEDLNRITQDEFLKLSPKTGTDEWIAHLKRHCKRLGDDERLILFFADPQTHENIKKTIRNFHRSNHKEVNSH